jgi:hypothetical protein
MQQVISPPFFGLRRFGFRQTFKKQYLESACQGTRYFSKSAKKIQTWESQNRRAPDADTI